MSNYYRLTAYHPKEDISLIADSNGKYEKLWQFSAFFVSKGFNVIAVGNDESFEDGNFGKAEPDPEFLILRACAKGQPLRNGSTITISGRFYTVG